MHLSGGQSICKASVKKLVQSILTCCYSHKDLPDVVVETVTTSECAQLSLEDYIALDSICNYTWTYLMYFLALNIGYIQ